MNKHDIANAVIWENRSKTDIVGDILDVVYNLQRSEEWKQSSDEMAIISANFAKWKEAECIDICDEELAFAHAGYYAAFGKFLPVLREVLKIVGKP